MPIDFVQQYMRKRNSGHSGLGVLQLLLGIAFVAATTREVVEDDSEFGLGSLCLGLALLGTGVLTLFAANKGESQISCLGRDPLQVSYQKALGTLFLGIGLASFSAGYLLPSFRSALWGNAIGAGLSASLNQPYAMGRWDEESKRLREAGEEMGECFRGEDCGHNALSSLKMFSGAVLAVGAAFILLGGTNSDSRETAIAMVSLGIALMGNELFGLSMMGSNRAKAFGLVCLLNGLACAALGAIAPAVRTILWGVAIGCALTGISNGSYAIGRWDEQKFDPERSAVLAPPQP